jgi:hypothetical protein
LENSILRQSTAVRTSVLPEVRKVIDCVIPDYDSVKNYSTNVVKWLSPVIDLSEFYVYPTNGITEGLNWWQNQETRGVAMNNGDYQWVRETGNEMQYISVPSAIDGNYTLVPTYVPVALDLAYVGSTVSKKIKIFNNVEFVFYSLSKSFGVRNVRTGWFFSRKPDLRLEALTHNAKYYNYYAHEVAETIISNFDIEYIHQRLASEQSRVCRILNLVPSNSVWLATSTDPLYSKFKRGAKARLCLSGVYNYE